MGPGASGAMEQFPEMTGTASAVLGNIPSSFLLLLVWLLNIFHI